MNAENQAREDRALRTIQRAIDTHKLTALVALYSGGLDSTVAAMIAKRHPLFVGCIHINTKTSPLSEWASREAIKRMEQFGLRYVVESPFTTFRQLVAKNGFPGPAAHPQTYQYLKGRAISAAKKKWVRILLSAEKAWNTVDTKTHRIGFITGIRAEESQRRATVPPIVLQDGTPWISPILDWKSADREPYLVDRFGFTSFNSSRGGVGECDCGAYAKPGEMDAKCTIQIMREYRDKMEELARISRELDMIEVRAGMRDEKDVMSEGFTEWGHGLNTRREAKRISAVSICNECDGQLTYDGSRVGEDVEFLAGLTMAIRDLPRLDRLTDGTAAD